ncbi:response regulator transcription factor [Micromonospora sp. NPDC048898]|uniref:response regulator transcription factor n=1 Tax=Micromonospora sp. NPDC048898 TaxID=3364260 RepID=UPI0037214819
MTAVVNEAATHTLDVAIVAASPLMLAGLAHSIDEIAGFRVAGKTESITSLPNDPAPPIVVIDLSGKPADDQSFWSLLPVGSRAVALCGPDKTPNLIMAAPHGLHALISRGSDIHELETALHAATAGALYISADLREPAVSAATGPSRRNELTQRELQVLQLLAHGMTHGQISRELGLSETTANTYVKRIRHKMHVGNKADLTRRAIELGYVPT